METSSPVEQTDALLDGVGLVLSGGSPNSPLIAGALCAIYDQGKTFDAIYTSGAGALMGLLFIAPKGRSPSQALHKIVEVGIADPIYRFFPVGYKVFFKPGPFTRPFHRWGEFFKLPGPTDRPGDAYKRLYNDWIDFCFAAITPTTVNYLSKGLCAAPPFLEDWVDFQKLQDSDVPFFMNAYNVTDAKQEEFEKPHIDLEHFYAALSFPFIYPPYELHGKLYYEGADRDPLNFPHLRDRVLNLQMPQTVVLMDILGSLEQCLVRDPRNLWDAYGISILTPIVALAKKNLQYFNEVENRDCKVKLIPVPFPIPQHQQPYIMEWSYSNLNTLWDIGYKTGLAFLETYGSKLSDRSTS